MKMIVLAASNGFEGSVHNNNGYTILHGLLLAQFAKPGNSYFFVNN